MYGLDEWGFSIGNIIGKLWKVVYSQQSVFALFGDIFDAWIFQKFFFYLIFDW